MCLIRIALRQHQEYYWIIYMPIYRVKQLSTLDLTLIVINNTIITVNNRLDNIYLIYLIENDIVTIFQNNQFIN